jgi:hypothetical protein
VPLDFTRTWENDAVLLRTGFVDLTESMLMSAGMVLFGTLMILRLRRAAPSTTVS